MRREQAKQLTLGWFAWRIAIILGLPTLAIFADYAGWLIIDTGRTVPIIVMLSIFVVLAIDAMRRKSFWASTLAIFTIFVGQSYLQSESRETREVARWRIVLTEACRSASLESSLSAQCADAWVRADYEPCNFGSTPEQCRVELYRDAGWPLNETEIPPHRSGQTLPLGR